MSTSPSPEAEPADLWPRLPTETEIYILPDGRIIVADLPVELADRLPNLGAVEACEIAPGDTPDASNFAYEGSSNSLQCATDK